MGKQQPIVTGYFRVGSEKQIKPSLKARLKKVNNDLAIEETMMKEIAAKFLASSEKYNKLRATQRTLNVQMYMSAQNREAAKKRG